MKLSKQSLVRGMVAEQTADVESRISAFHETCLFAIRFIL